MSAKEVAEELGKDGGLQMLPGQGLADAEVAERYGWVDGGPIRVPGPAARELFGQQPLSVRTVRLPRQKVLPADGGVSISNGSDEVEVEIHPLYPYEMDGAKVAASPGFS